MLFRIVQVWFRAYKVLDSGLLKGLSGSDFVVYSLV